MYDIYYFAGRVTVRKMEETSKGKENVELSASTVESTDISVERTDISTEDTSESLQTQESEHAKMIEESEKMPTEVVTEMETKIREAAKSKYTKEELDGIIKLGKIMASKAVLSMLITVIEEGPARGYDAAECKKLVSLVKQRMPFDYCGFVQCEFAEIDFKLNISLTLAEKSYRADISVPDAKYAGDLYRQYNFLKGVATAYWQQFTEDYNALYKRICQYRADVNFAELIIDKGSPTTMYFDPESKMRVGLLPYYVSADGKPLRKK